MTTNANVEITELSTDEMEAVSGGIGNVVGSLLAVGIVMGVKAVSGAAGWLAGGGSVSTIPWKDTIA